MNRSAKLIAMVLTLVLVLSALPTTALASADGGYPGVSATTVTVYAKCYSGDKLTTAVGIDDTKVLSDASITIDSETFGSYITYDGKIYEFYSISYNSKYQNSLTLADGGKHEVTVCYLPHVHSYLKGHNRINHWEACACGSTLLFEHHVDPATDEDSICTCGYEFSHNADLVTLWLANMVLEPRFDRDITEYNAAIHTYKEVTSTDVRVRTFDALATVEKPKDLSIQEGMNVFEVTVTAEDRKTTKTYTVFASLPTQVDGMQIGSTRTNGGDALTTAAPKATLRRSIAYVTLTEGIGKAMADQASQNESTQIILQPSFSKWSTKGLEVTVPAAALEAMAESKADFVITTFKGDVVIPNGELKNLAGEGESLLLSLSFAEEELTLTITADGEAVENSKVTVKTA